MIVTHKIKMDLARREMTPYIDVVQDDKYSRNIQIGLYESGRKLDIPADCMVLIRYKKPDGIGGAYDAMPDGTQAWMIAEHTVTIRVAPQVCTVPGDVTLTVTLLQGEQELNCFAICLRVQELPRVRMRSNAYVNISGFLPQTDNATVGEFLEIEDVDAQGRVTKLRSVPVVSSGSDWNAAEGKAGHVLNRTHWAETVLTDPTFDGDLSGHETVQMGDGLYAVKVSPEYVAVADMVGAAMLYATYDAEQSVTLTAETVIDATTVLGVAGTLVLLNGDMTVLSIPADSVVMGLAVSAGTWFGYIEGQFHVKSLSCLGTVEQESIHKLDNKFIDAEWMATKTEITQEIVSGLVFTGNGSQSSVNPTLLTTHDEVIVNFDGTDYVCPVTVRYELIYIGNFSLNGGDAAFNTGEPFCIYILPDTPDSITWCVDYKDESEHIASIAIKTLCVNKMPEEFLPEGYSKDELVAAVIAALPDAEGVSF